MEYLRKYNKQHNHIMQTCPCNEDPLTPHLYIVKLGFTGIHFFLIFAPKHRLWVLTINVLSKNKKNIKNFHLKINISTAMKYCCILHGRVIVMYQVSQGGGELTNQTILKHEYRKVPKFSDARKLCCSLPKIQTNRTNLRVFLQKDTNGTANSEDPDQTAPLGAV